MVTIVNNEYIPINGMSRQEILHSKEDDIIITIFGLQRNRKQECLFHFVSIVFLCIPYILLYWYPNWSKIKYKLCFLKHADYILVQDNLEQCKVIPVETVDYFFNDNHQLLRCFKYQHVKYIWKENLLSFCNIQEYVREVTLNDFFNHRTGLTKNQQTELQKLYGPNLIDIEVKSYWNLFVNEVFNPFYVFQAFSIILWSCDEYYYYAGCILFLSFLSIVTSLRETKKQSTALHNLVESSRSYSVSVCRLNIVDGEKNNESCDFEVIDPCYLVPGDIIQIPIHGCIMPCDAVLLAGNCIVNESMLTGESVPITKTPPNPSDEIYNPSIHKRHTLFSGTQVIQTRYYDDLKVLAQVVRTGFETTKGELVKSIMYPKPMGFTFYKDSMKFVFFLFFVALIGMSYCIYLYIKRQASVETILLRTLDIITIIVPPALPAAMTAGTIYSQTRLKKFGIYCMSPMKINVAGKIKLICFDKTGTLTHDGLNLYAVIPSNKYNFKEPVFNATEIEKKSPLLQAMACCHSLTRLDGIINGDPLDLNMFQATEWVLEEPGSENTRFEMLAPTIVYPPSENIQMSDVADDLTQMNNLPYQIGLLRQFPFSSTEQCMSVICRILGSKHMIVYVKGAPEKIAKLCKFESIPPNFYSLLTTYAMEGYRIIALAYKKLDKKFKWKDIQKISREKIECDLEFIGFLIMQNALKPQTTPIIKDLQTAKLRTVMITGDNIMTAISVGRDCGMIHPQENIVLVTVQNDTSDIKQEVPKIKFELLNSASIVSGAEGINNSDLSSVLLQNHIKYHFALDGKTWNVIRTYYASWIPKLILKGTIYARFRPEQKTQLIVALQELDYIVGMVGDGANDCGALRAAHVGISLSQAEASVAAPFTSSLQDISCVKHIVLEGRCALVTSFAIFKYMALYSFIQFFSVLILYTRASEFGNMEFLYIDLVVTTTLAICMGRQGPATVLVPARPKGSLVSLGNLVPLISQIIICASIQVLSIYVLILQVWYNPINEITIKYGEENVLCWDNTVIFTISSFQYLILALVYSKGKPFRKSAITNGLLVFSLLALTLINSVFLIYPLESLAEFMEIMPLKNKEKKFRNLLLIFPITNLILSTILETLVADTQWFKSLIHFVKRKKHPKNKFKILDQQFDRQEWFTLDNDFDMNNPTA